MVSDDDDIRDEIHLISGVVSDDDDIRDEIHLINGVRDEYQMMMISEMRYI